jgi:uncharacterized protein YyaL (SSP411 family)
LNRLADSKNPYLLQHAGDPVDWYPWCDEAFRRADAEDKPIFLSIGYSSCHWCHVMAEESFSDPEVAKALNDSYISIKVDREERPDVDSVYQDACLATTGQGGWPLTVIMDAGKKPFFAGTYFPKTRKHGRPGLLDILAKVSEMWRNDRQQLIHAGEMLTHLLSEGSEKREEADLGDDELVYAYSALRTEFDRDYGGFGYAPKFPMPVNLLFLLRYYRHTGDESALDMVEKTLVMMRRGGVYDQIGFGFHRYSTDHKWLVPHFEKMLYDNALLSLAYLEAHQATQKPFYAQVAREIFTYLLRDMQAPDGGFASAEDADSEDGEGRYYTWSRDEICEVLGSEDAEIFTRYFDITRKGNFSNGLSIPNLLNSRASALRIAGGETKEPAESDNADPPCATEDMLSQAFARLLEARTRRPRPFRDDKVLTAWNGLIVTAFARGGRVLGEQKYIDVAEGTADFVLKTLRRPDGRLLARYRKGEAAIPAYLDDYAFFIQGLIELWEARFESDYVQAAIELTEQQINLFWDKEDGGFYFTSHDSHELPVRRKDARDGALPSGNSVSAHNLIRLARLTGREEWEETAKELLKSFSGNVSRYPSAFPMLLSAWLLSDSPPIEIVIAGRSDKPDTRRLWQAVNSLFLPEATVSHNPGGIDGDNLAVILPPIFGKEPAPDKALAYVCQGLACLEPISEPDALRAALNSTQPVTTLVDG